MQNRTCPSWKEAFHGPFFALSLIGSFFTTVYQLRQREVSLAHPIGRPEWDVFSGAGGKSPNDRGWRGHAAVG
jgi:hypothetical protein